MYLGGSGHSSGIWVLACQSVFAFSVLDSFHQGVTIKISSAAYSWACATVYGSPTPSLWVSLLEHLANLRQQLRIPWILFGDFNEVLGCLKV